MKRSEERSTGHITCNTRAAPEGLARGQKKVMGIHARLPLAWYDLLTCRAVAKAHLKVRGFPVRGGLNGPGVFRVLHPHMAYNVCSQSLCATSAVVDLQHLQCPPATSGGHAPPHGREHVILSTERSTEV